MSDFETYLKLKKQSRNIYIIFGMVVILLFFLLYRGCSNSRSSLAKAAENKAIADSLRNKMELESDMMDKERTQYYADILEASNESIATEKRVDSLQKQLGSSQTEVSRLAKQVRYFKEGMPDDELVTVHPRYIQSCDSLADKAEEQNVQIEGLKFESNALKITLQNEISLRDTQIEKEKQYSKKLGDIAFRYSQLYESAAKTNKPRNKVFLKGSIELLPINAVIIGGGFTAVEKHGNLWEIQAKYYKGWGFELSYGRLLSFRRK